MGKNFLRDKGVVISLVALPLLLMSVAKKSAPKDPIQFTLDSKMLVTDSEVMILALYALTSVVLVAAVTSFFLAFNMKTLLPRLRIVGYTTGEIAGAFFILASLVNLISVIFVWMYSLNAIDIRDPNGFLISLSLVAIIMSIFGLLTAELVSSRTLGLYVILSLAIIDTAFMENPVFSRRYNDDWIGFMPSHHSLTILLRSIFDTGINWSDGLISVGIYIVILFISYFVIRSWRQSS